MSGRGVTTQWHIGLIKLLLVLSVFEARTRQLMRQNVLTTLAIRHNQSAREGCRIEKKLRTPIYFRASNGYRYVMMVFISSFGRCGNKFSIMDNGPRSPKGDLWSLCP